MKEIVYTLLACAVLVAGLAVWSSFESESPTELRSSDEDITSPRTPERSAADNPERNNMTNPTATFQTNRGDITLELYQNDMPITVGNFVTLAQDGFYDGTKFHRVIEGFMIQGGDPNSRGDDTSQYGTGGPGYTIQDEFVEGEYLRNERGTIAMANTGQPDSGGSQFFINVAENSGLNFDEPPMQSRHPVFGRVIEGMDVVDAIERTETGARDVPVEPIVIESVTITEGS